jgi:hypothetical protein
MCGGSRAPPKTKVEHMTRETILYIFDQTAGSNSVLAALRATGYDIVSTNSAMQAIALLFVMHSVAAVVLDYPTREEASLDEARSLRAVCPSVRIVLLRNDPIDRLPSFVDACVSTRQPLENLTCAIRHLLNAKSVPSVVHNSDPDASNPCMKPDEAAVLTAGLPER